MIPNKFLFTVLVILSVGNFAQNRNITCKFLEEALYLKLNCYFPEDISVTRKDFSVYHYPTIKDGERAVRLVSCYWIRVKDFECDIKEGYEYNKIIHPDHISILIINVSSNHLGKYECQLPGDKGSCDLLTVPILTDMVEKNPSQETQAQVSTTIGAGTLESLPAEDGISVGAGIGIGVGVGLVLILGLSAGAYFWRKKSKRTPENDNRNDNTSGETEPLAANRETTGDQNESQRTDNFGRPNKEEEEPPSEQRRNSLPQNDETNDHQNEAHRITNSYMATPQGNTPSPITNLPEVLLNLGGRDLHWEKTETECRGADGSRNINKMERLRIINTPAEGRNTSVEQEGQPVSCSVQDTYQKESINESKEEEEEEEDDDDKMTASLHSRDADSNIRDHLRQKNSHLTAARKLNKKDDVSKHQEDSLSMECAPAGGNVKVREKVTKKKTDTDC
ncbi:uncharacterized protein LOC112569187 [Pomacea canaliculata]|uniref:uncharacterized protein LOC112569187 n=1 Tax=Pomacea canaliculata TaxID=400727 RepID=UPI000D735D94|nr:uncharacterized protein LOC112569187 [Pomacea canaliculata]XP_025102698.1 uncharacterized protein LOC112569187 [Pomacea canaliculata]